MLAEHEPPIVLHLGPVLRKMNAHEFFQLCRLNPDWRLERTREGDLVIRPPTGGKTGQRNFTLTAMFGAWVQADGTGVGFDSSTGFTLPNGAQLGWLVDPQEKKVYVYRPQAPVECLDHLETISGEPLLPGFVLPLAKIWK